MRLSLKGIQDPGFAKKGYVLPQFDISAMRQRTLAAPAWVHFGAGNILRAFPAVLCQKLLESGDAQTGLCVVECYDEDIIRKAFAPYDDLALAVSLKSDGTVEKRVVASVAQALGYAADTARVNEIVTVPSLQMISMTITEKGYSVLDASGAPLAFCAGDFTSMDAPVSIIGKLVKLLYARYRAGAYPVAMVSMDNCSHNGAILQSAVMAVADSLRKNGLVEQGFLNYLGDPEKVSFPWSMIDKITPRPAQAVLNMLAGDGLEDMNAVVTAKNTYVSAMVNAEECEYLAIEDTFPNGRPPLEKTGVIFADRETVNKIEKMKVCTCLNPLHTALAVFGCLLNYSRICEEMKDGDLVRLIQRIGYIEGMPVVVNPGVMSATKFIDEVVKLRLPNPYMPDTPQRIACDTSKKIPVRFGETIKSYAASDTLNVQSLIGIPLVIAGWLRYLLAADDAGNPMALSADPMLPSLQASLAGIELGKPETLKGQLRPILSNKALFGSDLMEIGLGEKIEGMLREMLAGRGAVRSALQKYV